MFTLRKLFRNGQTVSGRSTLQPLLTGSLCFLLAVGVLTAADSKKNEKAKKVTKSAKWEVKPDPPETAIEWPAELSLSIEQPPRVEEILFPTTPSEFVLVGLDAYDSDRAELWNLPTGQRMGVMNGTPVKSNRRALSPDGKYLALAALDRKSANEVEVWSMETGKRVSTFPADAKEMSMTIIDFAGPGEVLTYTFGQQNGKFGFHLRIWDAEKGTALRQIDLDKNLSGDGRYDISPGRNFLASIVIPEVLILDLQKGRIKGTISPPVKTEDGKHVTIDSVRFSPDGNEIAVMSEGQLSGVIAVHDMATGNKKLTHEVTAPQKNSLQHPASYKGPHLEFVTVPNGFLLYGGGFIERETGLMVWNYRMGILEFSHWKRILTPAGLIVSTGGNNSRKIQVTPFPSEKLAKSIDAYRGSTPALVKPGEKVKLTVEVGEVRFGKPEDTKKGIERALAERLAEDGLAVADDGATVMTIQYKETAGKTLQEVKGGTPLGGGGVATGRSVQSTAGELKLAWTSKDGNTPIYTETINLDPSRLMVRDSGDVTDEKIRQQVFAILKIQLSSLPMPFFVPTDKELMVLPMVTTSQMAAPASPDDALKAKIEAKKKKIAK